MLGVSRIGFPDLGFRVEGFEDRGFGLGVSATGFRDSGFWSTEFRGFGYEVSGTRSRYMVLRFGVSGTWFRCSRFREVCSFGGLGFGYGVSRFEVFKVRGFAYVYSGWGFEVSGFRGSGLQVRGS